MKKLAILLIFAAPILFTGCFGGDTELGWENGNSANPVRDITWSEVAGGTPDLDWGSEVVAASTTSTTKTPNVLNGYVECTHDTDNGQGFVEAQVAISGTSSDNAVLAEGSTNIFTITTSAKKK